MANSTKEKKIPMRKCTGCGVSFPKGELLRVLRTPEGEIVLDSTGKRSGRGAYICKSLECFKKSRKKKRLDVSLECKIPESIYDAIEGALV